MNPNDILVFFGQITIVVMIIPIVTAIVYWKNLDRKLKIFFLFCCVTLFLSGTEIFLIWNVKKYYQEFWKPILDYWNIENTNFFAILFYLRDFILLGWFFSKVLRPLKIALWIKLISVILAILSIVNYVFIEGYLEPGIFNPTADAMFCFIIPMIGIWYVYCSDIKIEMNKNPVFWICLGLILPNLLSLFLYFTSDYLQAEDFSLYVNFMLIKNFFEIIGIILLTIGFTRAYYMRFFYPSATK